MLLESSFRIRVSDSVEASLSPERESVHTASGLNRVYERQGAGGMEVGAVTSGENVARVVFGERRRVLELAAHEERTREALAVAAAEAKRLAEMRGQQR